MRVRDSVEERRFLEREKEKSDNADQYAAFPDPKKLLRY